MSHAAAGLRQRHDLGIELFDLLPQSLEPLLHFRRLGRHTTWNWLAAFDAQQTDAEGCLFLVERDFLLHQLGQLLLLLDEQLLAEHFLFQLAQDQRGAPAVDAA